MSGWLLLLLFVEMFVVTWIRLGNVRQLARNLFRLSDLFLGSFAVRHVLSSFLDRREVDPNKIKC